MQDRENEVEIKVYQLNEDGTPGQEIKGENAKKIIEKIGVPFQISDEDEIDELIERFKQPLPPNIKKKENVIYGAFDSNDDEQEEFDNDTLEIVSKMLKDDDNDDISDISDISDKMFGIDDINRSKRQENVSRLLYLEKQIRELKQFKAKKINSLNAIERSLVKFQKQYDELVAKMEDDKLQNKGVPENGQEVQVRLKDTYGIDFLTYYQQGTIVQNERDPKSHEELSAEDRLLNAIFSSSESESINYEIPKDGFYRYQVNYDTGLCEWVRYDERRIASWEPYHKEE